MDILPTQISDVKIVKHTSIKDQRGKFSRFFCNDELKTILGKRKITQINHSTNISTGTTRGLHYQLPPHSEMKLIRCIKGRVWDLALDLRTGSPTYLQWHAEELSARNGKMIAIPEGCAHGFQVLEDHSELLYLHTEAYHSSSERGLRYNDPALNIEWPLKATHISERDTNHPLLSSSFKGVQL